jgi:hypothetical protein
VKLKYWAAFLAAAVALVCTAPAACAEDPFWSLLSPRETPAVATEAREGEVFLSVAARHRLVGFLENDIRGTGIVNSDRIVVPRGTPVYFATFGTSGGAFGAGARHYEGWCAVLYEGERERGYCMLQNGRGYGLAPLPRDGSLYAPTRLANYGLRPITTPEVRVDDGALGQLPQIMFHYALDAWRPGGLVLERSASIDGQLFALGSIFIDRNPDRTATLAIDEYRYTVSMSGGGAAITVAPAQN